MVDPRDWIGRSESTTDTIAATPVRALAATLNDAGALVEPGWPLPPLWHWLYCLPLPPTAGLAADGNAPGGALRPPTALPRRMAAGCRFEFFEPLRVGDRVLKTSTITDVREKAGRSGPLLFLTLRHDWRRNDETAPALIEHQDVVYRDHAQPQEQRPRPQQAPQQAQWTLRIEADPLLLFRYSALTFNSHRIHLDRHYAVEVEGYPGLVVQGPLTATLLLELLRRELPGLRLARFGFTAVAPLFEGRPFEVCARRETTGAIELWVRDHHGHLAMRGQATEI